MGMQEYLVTKKHHDIKDFLAVFKDDVTCIATALRSISGIESKLSTIKKGTELVVLYRDRHEIKYMLMDKFPKEHFWYSESINMAATGTCFPSKEQMREIFKDHVIVR